MDTNLLGALGVQAVALARAAAVLDDGVPERSAADLAGLDGDDAERAADALVAAGMLAPERPLRFSHPLLRAAVYVRIGPGACTGARCACSWIPARLPLTHSPSSPRAELRVAEVAGRRELARGLAGNPGRGMSAAA
jgi:hypothetical protein